MDSGKRFGFWEVFWIMGSVLSLWATVSISSCAPIKSKLQHPRPGKPKACELLKIGSFKYSSPHEPKWCSNALPYLRICLSNAPPKEKPSSVPVVCNEACVYSRYAETLIQDGKAILEAGYVVQGTL